MLIATRNLTLVTPSGSTVVEVNIYAPMQNGRGWECRYTIDWPGKPREGIGQGIDGIQALHIAMQKIAVDLYTSGEHASGKLRWDKPGNGYGFPIVKPMRDVLQGDDRKFDG